MTLTRLFNIGQHIATLDSKANPGKLGRVYAAAESRGYQTNYKPKLFFFIVPYSENGLPTGCVGITRDARRKQIPQYSNITILNQELWNQFMS